MRSLPPLALDTAHFATLRRNGQVYVDKTAYIQRMLAERRRYVFLARPRRFGKSLLVSTLAHLFGRADDALFQDLDIGLSGFLEHAPRVPVLQLDMSSTGASEPDVDMHRALRRVVGAGLRPYGLAPAPDALSWEALEDAIWDLRARHADRGVAVLVDEYDAPLTDLWSAGARPSRERQDRILDHLRAFYRVLKKMDACLTFVFLTGILRVEGAGLFSALNNLDNLSDLASYSGLCGFTEPEIDRYLAGHLQQAATYCGQSEADMRSALRRHYNGYRFAVTGEPVYNPISCLTALRQLAQAKDAREIQATAWPRPWLTLGQTQFLFRYMAAERQDLRHIDFDAAGAQSTFDWRRPSLNALLYQMGFLTLVRDPDGQIRLDFPNWEVETALKEGLCFTYLGLMMGRASPEWELVQRMAHALRDHDCRSAIAAFDRILDRVSYQELGAESHYQIALHLICALCQSVLRVDSEAPGRRGRADIVVETRDTFYVFELKLNQSTATALEQIVARGYLNKYAVAGKRVVGVGLNFIQASAKEARDAAPRARPSYVWASVAGAGTLLAAQEKPAVEAPGTEADG